MLDTVLKCFTAMKSFNPHSDPVGPEEGLLLLSSILLRLHFTKKEMKVQKGRLVQSYTTSKGQN